MLVDLSSNGSWVDQDLVASNKARGLAISKGIPVECNYRRIALQPEKWHLISTGKVQLQIKVGKATPPSFVPDKGELGLNNLHLQSNPISSSALTLSMLIKPAFVDQATSRKFHCMENYTFGTSIRHEATRG